MVEEHRTGTPAPILEPARRSRKNWQNQFTSLLQSLYVSMFLADRSQYGRACMLQYCVRLSPPIVVFLYTECD